MQSKGRTAPYSRCVYAESARLERRNSRRVALVSSNSKLALSPLTSASCLGSGHPGSSHSAKGSLCSNPIATQQGCLDGPEHSASGVLRHLACSTAGSFPSSSLFARSCFDVSFTRRVSLSSELLRRGCARNVYPTSQPIFTGLDCPVRLSA